MYLNHYYVDIYIQFGNGWWIRILLQSCLLVVNLLSFLSDAAGMLWSGEAPNVGELEENMGVYCNMLQGFLLLCHGSMVGAGPTLRASVRASAKQVIDGSVSLLREAVSSYGMLSPYSLLRHCCDCTYLFNWKSCQKKYIMLWNFVDMIGPHYRWPICRKNCQGLGS